MGERSKDALRLDFDRKMKVEFHGTKVTSDAGLLAYRELDEVLGLTTMADSELTDSRTGKNTPHARYVTFQMAEVLVSKRLFEEILERIHQLKPAGIEYG